MANPYDPWIIRKDNFKVRLRGDAEGFFRLYITNTRGDEANVTVTLEAASVRRVLSKKPVPAQWANSGDAVSARIAPQDSGVVDLLNASELPWQLLRADEEPIPVTTMDLTIDVVIVFARSNAVERCEFQLHFAESDATMVEYTTEGGQGAHG